MKIAWDINSKVEVLVIINTIYKVKHCARDSQQRKKLIVKDTISITDYHGEINSAAWIFRVELLYVYSVKLLTRSDIVLNCNFWIFNNLYEKLIHAFW